MDYNNPPAPGSVIGKGGNAVVYEELADKTKVLKMSLSKLLVSTNIMAPGVQRKYAMIMAILLVLE